jgi:hypothetical protein
MSKETPKNVVLNQSKPAADPDAVLPGGGDVVSDEYPKALYHKDSKPGHPISKVVQSADEEQQAAKDGWSTLADLPVGKAEKAPPVPKDE